MCLMAWALGQDPAAPLWVAANRDEQWDRPTLPLHAWTLPQGGTVWSGRDAQAGGSWLAFGSAGRVAMLTNVRAWPPEPAQDRSRGSLVTAWLSPEDLPTWAEFAHRHDPMAYNGCNVVLGDVLQGRWAWLTNRDPGPALADDPATERVGGWWARELPPGVYALSNAALDTPWPKLRRLKSALDQALATPRVDAACCTLLEALRTHVPSADVGQHLESSPYVHLPERRYGTRSSLIARWDRAGTLTLTEWTYASPQGPAAADRADQRRISIDWWGMPTSS
ncbi:Transport and Golgi organization 2 [Tepidimonas fonticaldi]|uniref:Transport and Golgi organization 2 n=1 Tax=Tepidimonas fonticaldi TaxID=1101373 RepID=A0A554XR22_9BURK|nr:NRDE family protein [Tepidimonas fonticaldi]TSE38255.1 Transport and Golgi organization 2 [Tepidimonas fonticaldi]